jgi:hypothetical protein
MKNAWAELIDDHWSYIEELLKIHGEDEAVIKKIAYHYRTAFAHGLKHADRAKEGG